jgi:hypothetical protein
VIWAVASVLLGWGVGQLSLAFLAFLAIPFSVPFGYPDQYLGGEPPPLWLVATFYAFISASLIFSSALIRMALKPVYQSETCRRTHESVLGGNPRR